MDASANAGNRPHVRVVRHGLHVWTVYEHVPAYDRRGTPTLVFESPEVVRRVRAFPPDWHSLSDDALAALAEGR